MGELWGLDFDSYTIGGRTLPGSWPCEGVISQLFGGQHGGVDIAPFTPGVPGTPMYAPHDADAVETHSPGDGWGDGSFGNCVLMHDPVDGLWTIVAHLMSLAPVLLSAPLKAGTFIGEMGYSGYTIPAGPAGTHTHFAICDSRWIPKYEQKTAWQFRDPIAMIRNERTDPMIAQQVAAQDIRLRNLELLMGGNGFAFGGSIPLNDDPNTPTSDIALDADGMNPGRIIAAMVTSGNSFPLGFQQLQARYAKHIQNAQG